MTVLKLILITTVTLLETLLIEYLTTYNENENVVTVLYELKDVLQVFYIDDMVDGKPVLDKVTSLIRKLHDYVC